MRLTRKQKRQIVVGIAIVLILYGILDKLFQFNIDKKVIDNVSLVLMVLAFGLLFSRSNDKKEEAADVDKQEPMSLDQESNNAKEEAADVDKQEPMSLDQESSIAKEGTADTEKQVPPSQDPESLSEQMALENDLIKDQDKGATNNEDTRNDLRS